MNMKKIKSAFTILEVVLAMTVLGIISMIMMSVIHSSSSTETLYAALNKNNTYLNQVFQTIPMLKAQGKIPMGNITAEQFLRAVALSSKCIDLKTDGTKIPAANRKFASYIYTNRPNNTGIATYDSFSVDSPNDLDNNNNNTIILKNNVIISTFVVEPIPYIVMDINGTKAPNRTGLDIYFYKIENGALVSANTADNCAVGGTYITSGGCVAKYLQNGGIEN